MLVGLVFKAPDLAVLLKHPRHLTGKGAHHIDELAPPVRVAQRGAHGRGGDVVVRERIAHHQRRRLPPGALAQNVVEKLPDMADVGLVLLVHGEVTHDHVDIFDREAVFIDTILAPLTERHPQLRVVLEHITTRAAVDFVTRAGPNVAATITAHHLLYNRNHLLAGGIRPHYYCLPILKRRSHQAALIEAATSGNNKFFLGTDSAPHAQHKKEAACGCAGAYTAYAAIELYAEAFEQAGALQRLEGFASHFGADFYRLPRNTQTVTLHKQAWRAPEQLEMAGTALIPLRAGETIPWRLHLLQPLPEGQL